MADPDLQIRGGGGGVGGRSSRPGDKGEDPVSKKICFGPSGLILVDK